MSNNKISQSNKKGTSGLRIAAGEDHIIFNNLISNSSITSVNVNSGQTSGIYNLPVKNLQVVNNLTINSGVDYIIGSNSYSINPFNCVYRYNTIYKNNMLPVFSIKDYSNLFFENNIYYCNNVSKKIEPTESVINPANFDIKKFNLNNYGSIEATGTDWDNLPENTEIKIDLEIYYNKIKTNILVDLSNYLPNEDPIGHSFQPIVPKSAFHSCIIL
jgi:hypothetical protein